MKFLLSALIIPLILISTAQEIPYPPLSPKGSIEQVIGNTTFKIEYERPSVRERVVFGELVPFGKVWRTGAGHSTLISFDRPVKIYDQEIPSGTYSLFTKPGPSEWMVMINKDTSLVGSRGYKPINDIIQIIAKPAKTKRLYETMTFDIEMVRNHARISLSWERTQISFLIQTTTNDEINAQIKARLLTGQSSEFDEYVGGAAFLLSLGEDLNPALELTEKAIELDGKSIRARNLKIELCERLEKYQEALEEIDTTVELLKSNGNRDQEISRLLKASKRITKLKKKAKK